MKSKFATFFAVPIIVACLLYCAGCATIFKGSSEKVDISSDPFGAKVYVNGNLMGKTPLQLKLQSSKTYYIEFAKDGYENKTVLITNSVGAGWIILDVIFGLVPIVVDAATGNWYSLDDDNVRAVLKREHGIKILEDTTQTNATEETQQENPLLFSLELETKETKTVLGGKVAITYTNQPFSRSKLDFKGIFGVAKDRMGPFNDVFIEISKDDVFYIQVMSDLSYRIEVEQETHKTITLNFTKM
ncbi:MAG: PEGA domain-containing protein [Ignavibacteriales bacterium]|nr:PEGA domain-containing protein [Ignavibacteriales bacterium]